MYSYKFEAWTQSGTRTLWIQYYYDPDEKKSLWTSVPQITNQRTTYTVYSEVIPKGGLRNLEFQCADQLGTFYVKILEIKELTSTGPSTLTIVNFSGNPGLTQGIINGYAAPWGTDFSSSTILYFTSSQDDKGSKPVTGSIITLFVWKGIYPDINNFTPFTENVTVGANLLQLQNDKEDGTGQYSINYRNKVPITFTNGSAIINFGAQMELYTPPPPPGP